MGEMRPLLPWHDRPSEEAALLNPAFCGELIARAAHDYERLAKRPFPLPLAYLILPLTLYPLTRDALPGKANTTFATWSAAHDVLLAELPDRVLALRPVTREALLFLTQHQALALGPEGLSRGASPLALSAKLPVTSNDATSARRAAGLIGRWFANQGTTVTVLQTMGVMP
jgi:hypothetical protein